MRMPWKPKEEPYGGIVGAPTDKQGELEKRLKKAEEELRRLHEITYGDKSTCCINVWIDYNGETNKFTIGNMLWKWGTWGLSDIPKKGDKELCMNQEEAMRIAEFIIDNYKGGNK